MKNPMLNLLQSNNTSRAAQMFSMLKGVKNPASMLQDSLRRNPALGQILNECGGDYRQAFYAYADKLGVDPNEILSVIR